MLFLTSNLLAIKMSNLLKVDNFSLSFCSNDPNQERTKVLNEISFSLGRGETHALVGESGSGKSVTALSILRLLEDSSTIQTDGKIIFDGKNIQSLNSIGIQSLRGNRIAMIFQEPMTSLNPVYTIGNQLIEPLMLHQKLPRYAARKQSIELLDRTGILQAKDRIDSYPHQLSGGQRQRVMIAMALACQPDLLIADEPTTALDVTIEKQILELIKDLQQEFNMAMLLITHDLPLVKKYAENISIMHKGRIIEQGNTLKIFNHPSKDYTKLLLSSMPDIAPQKTLPTSNIITMDNIHCEFTIKTEWTSIFKRKKTVIKAVNGVSLKVQKGSTLGIVGESGSGKSTLAMCLLRLIKSNGTIKYHSNNKVITLTNLPARHIKPLRKNLQIIFQDPYSSLSPRFSIEQIIGEGIKAHNLCNNNKELKQMVSQALLDVELDPDMASRYPHEFSGGQRQRIAIARAIILKPELLILDEPTSALDMTIQAQIIMLLKALQEKQNMTYIFITHDLRVIRSLADHLVVMKNGEIVEEGRSADLFNNPKNIYTKKLFQAAFHKNSLN